ncbi:hypothetical protein PanWU01x14_309870 [Parasponia andersonii]|uniref:Uncharacterized protein n=1 Tax=Parasponia andersonii TaxID=3476 RepID=A0A2P5AQH8_PARAD|nr:hypothetical protein PanWU01x14_309870 [Parasponia andersonii]
MVTCILSQNFLLIIDQYIHHFTESNSPCRTPYFSFFFSSPCYTTLEFHNTRSYNESKRRKCVNWFTKLELSCPKNKLMKLELCFLAANLYFSPLMLAEPCMILLKDSTQYV